MEVINERQVYPFLLTCATTFVIIAGSYGLLAVSDAGTASINKVYWYMARSAGFISYEMLALTVILGVSGTSRIWDKLKLRKLVTQMHQYGALMVLPFLCFHLWGLHQDTSVPFPFENLIVPMQSTYQPIGTGLGVLTLYGLVVLIVSSMLRSKMSVRVWRAIHFLSFPMYIAVTVHGLVSGTDSHQGWALLLYVVPTVLVIGLTLRRFSKRPVPPVNPRPAVRES